MGKQFVFSLLTMVALCGIQSCGPALAGHSSSAASSVVTFALAEIAQWCPGVQVVVSDTVEWERYVNELHFVSGEFDGLAPGEKFSFEKDQEGFVPTGELTETGMYTIWCDRCTFFGLTGDACRAAIAVDVKHECRHYRQWRDLATQVAATVSPSAAAPRTLADLAVLPGATQRFLSVWSDGSHYQCREVEVYVEQLETGESDTGSLQQLRLYRDGCRTSKWASQFSNQLERADKWLLQTSK